MKEVGLCPYMGNGCVYGLIWGRHNTTGFGVTKSDHPLLLIYIYIYIYI